jgi:hypothetical protein
MTIYLKRDFKLYTPRGKELLELTGRLLSHPRCHVAGHDGDPSWIIGMSDLTVGSPFTSPVIEAIGAGRKALFYDPLSRYYGNIYDSIGLVAHGFDELSREVRRLLDEIDTNQFMNSLKDGASLIVDPFFDGGALDRFRRLLTGSRN